MIETSHASPSPGARRVVQRALPTRVARTPGMLLGVLADITVVALLGLSMWLIVRSAEQPPILHLTFAVVGVRALAIGRAALRYLERLASHDAAFAQLGRLRTATFEALVPRVPGALGDRPRGEVLGGFVDDLDALQDEALRVRQPFWVSVLVTLLSIAVLALIHPIASFILFVALAVSCGLAVWVSHRVAGHTERELAAARGELADALLERIAAAETLAAFGALSRARGRIEAAELRLAAVQRRSVRSVGFTGAIVGLGAGLASLGILLALRPLTGTEVSATLFAAAVIVPAAVAEVSVQLPLAIAARRAVWASAERVAVLTETPIPPEIPVEDAVNEAPNTAGSHAVTERAARDRPSGDDSAAVPFLTLTEVTARYPGAARPAMPPVSAQVHAGELLIVTGESGSGKSTLASVLVRMLEYDGSYHLHGVEARTLPLSTVRTQIGLCEQQPHVFAADLRQNLKFARETASDDELYAVLDRVGLADWARERDGLDTDLGQRGSLVSGGQAQRIALARVLLADFPVVVLDEPTAGVDRTRADALLRDLLGALPADRAAVLITHTQVPAGVTGQHLHLEAPAPAGDSE